MVGTALATLSEVWGELQRAAGATDRLMELLHEKSVIEEPATPATVAIANRPKLRLDAVSFC
jgi:ATP-binding cassette subfamily B protein